MKKVYTNRHNQVIGSFISQYKTFEETIYCNFGNIVSFCHYGANVFSQQLLLYSGGRLLLQ
jgi:hypothetical protein